MAANEDDIVMFRGDSYDQPFVIADDAGVPVVLTGATLKMTVTTLKDPPDNTTKLFDMVGTVDADPATGKVKFRPTVGNTATIGKYFYDIELTGADGSVRTVQKARFDVIQDNTKPATP